MGCAELSMRERMQSHLWDCVEVVLGRKGYNHTTEPLCVLAPSLDPWQSLGKRTSDLHGLTPLSPWSLQFPQHWVWEVSLLSNTHHFLALLKQYSKYLSSSASEHAIRQNANNPEHRIWYGLSLLRASLVFCPQICCIYLHHVL